MGDSAPENTLSHLSVLTEFPLLNTGKKSILLTCDLMRHITCPSNSCWVVGVLQVEQQLVTGPDSLGCHKRVSVETMHPPSSQVDGSTPCCTPPGQKVKIQIKSEQSVEPCPPAWRGQHKASDSLGDVLLSWRPVNVSHHTLHHPLDALVNAVPAGTEVT